MSFKLSLTIALTGLTLGLVGQTAQAAGLKSEKMISLEKRMTHLKHVVAIDRDKIATGYTWRRIGHGKGYVIESVNTVINTRVAKLHLHSTNRLLAYLWTQWKREKRQHEYSLFGNLNAWLCIHSHEGSWTAATGNGYYGGLQMDLGFQNHYGSELLRAKGTANNWTWKEQVMVAQRAFNMGRGYYPWPNTARMCGLI